MKPIRMPAGWRPPAEAVATAPAPEEARQPPAVYCGHRYGLLSNCVACLLVGGRPDAAVLRCAECAEEHEEEHREPMPPEPEDT